MLSDVCDGDTGKEQQCNHDGLYPKTGSQDESKGSGDKKTKFSKCWFCFVNFSVVLHFVASKNYSNLAHNTWKCM